MSQSPPISSRLSRLPGLCNQCAADYDLIPGGHHDFGELPSDRRNVHCYVCGDIKVNQAGECKTKCSERHNWSWVDKLRWNLIRVTP